MSEIRAVKFVHDGHHNPAQPFHWSFRTKTFRGVKHPDLNTHYNYPTDADLRGTAAHKTLSRSNTDVRLWHLVEKLKLPHSTADAMKVVNNKPGWAATTCKLSEYPEYVNNNYIEQERPTFFGASIEGNLGIPDPVILSMFDLWALRWIPTNVLPMWTHREGDTLRIVMAFAALHSPLCFASIDRPSNFQSVAPLIRLLSQCMMSPGLAISVYMQTFARPSKYSKQGMFNELVAHANKGLKDMYLGVRQGTSSKDNVVNVSFTKVAEAEKEDS